MDKTKYLLQVGDVVQSADLSDWRNGDSLAFSVNGKAYKYFVPKGEYVVTKVSLDGGGQDRDGYHPNGHHVFVSRLDGEGRFVPGTFKGYFFEYKEGVYTFDFYQSGGFDSLIEGEILPRRKMAMTFV